MNKLIITLIKTCTQAIVNNIENDVYRVIYHIYIYTYVRLRTLHKSMDLLIIKYDMYSSASTFHKLQWNIIDHKEQNKTYFWTYSFFTSIISFFGAHRKDILLRDLWCKLGSFNKCTWQKQHKRMHDENETNGENGLKKTFVISVGFYNFFSHSIN